MLCRHPRQAWGTLGDRECRWLTQGVFSCGPGSRLIHTPGGDQSLSITY